MYLIYISSDNIASAVHKIDHLVRHTGNWKGGISKTAALSAFIIRIRIISYYCYGIVLLPQWQFPLLVWLKPKVNARC